MAEPRPSGVAMSMAMPVTSSDPVSSALSENCSPRGFQLSPQRDPVSTLSMNRQVRPTRATTMRALTTTESSAASSRTVRTTASLRIRLRLPWRSATVRAIRTRPPRGW